MMKRQTDFLLKMDIYDILKNYGRLSTTRVCAISGTSQERVLRMLQELLKEKKVKMVEETLATYWEVA